MSFVAAQLGDSLAFLPLRAATASVVQLSPPPFPMNTVRSSLDFSFNPAQRSLWSPYRYAIRNATNIVSSLPAILSPNSRRPTDPCAKSARSCRAPVVSLVPENRSTFPALAR